MKPIKLTKVAFSRPVLIPGVGGDCYGVRNTALADGETNATQLKIDPTLEMEIVGSWVRVGSCMIPGDKVAYVELADPVPSRGAASAGAGTSAPSTGDSK